MSSFNGLVRNYLSYKSMDVLDAGRIPHAYSYADEPLCKLTALMEKRSQDKFDKFVNILLSDELSFMKFGSILNQIYDCNELTHARALGAFTMCGMYVQRLVTLYRDDQIPPSFQNEAKYINQIHQVTLYLTKLLDSKLISPDDFINYIVSTEKLFHASPKWFVPSVSHVVTAGIVAYVVYRLFAA